MCVSALAGSLGAGKKNESCKKSGQDGMKISARTERRWKEEGRSRGGEQGWC